MKKIVLLILASLFACASMRAIVIKRLINKMDRKVLLWYVKSHLGYGKGAQHVVINPGETKENINVAGRYFELSWGDEDGFGESGQQLDDIRFDSIIVEKSGNIVMIKENKKRIVIKPKATKEEL